jgi:hypothetical protein
VQGENPISVVTKSKSLCVRVAPFTPGPSAQNKNKKGLAPQQPLKNNSGNNLEASPGNKTGDPHIQTTINIFSQRLLKNPYFATP